MDSYTKKIKKIINEFDFPKLCYVHSFGCQQNVSDGEKIIGLLSSLGYGITNDVNNADVIIYNTCAVRENAEQKVYGMIGELKHLKEQKPDIIIGICGCMAQEEKTARLLFEVYTTRKFISDIGEYNCLETEFKAIRSSKFKASVPIMYGCNNFCSYCIVPYVRGREQSRTPEAILNEVKQLAADGYKEIMLLGQNVNSYGKTLDKPVSFAELLKQINDIDGDFKIRFMSPHPKDMTKELIDVVFECDKICKHIHLPLQSGSNNILKEMNRRYTVEKYLDIVSYIRSKNPEFSITTDIIVGFPNETYNDFLKTKEIVEKVKYDNIFSFIYSKRTGTKAAEIDDKTSEEDKSRWMTELLQTQREISTEHYKRFVGRTMTVLFDTEGKHTGIYTGKSDEFIIVEAEYPDNSIIGERKQVKITKAYNWALHGEIL